MMVGRFPVRVFRQFSWLKAGSVKATLSRPPHLRVTHTVGRLIAGQAFSRCSKKRLYGELIYADPIHH